MDRVDKLSLLHAKKAAVEQGGGADKIAKQHEAGKMTATVAQQPTLIGELGVESADKVIKGETVEKYVPVELKLVTKK